MTVAACKFKYSDATYDYLLPPDLILSIGDKVIVETKRGLKTVEVVEIKDESDKATAFVVEKVPDLEEIREFNIAAKKEIEANDE